MSGKGGKGDGSGTTTGPTLISTLPLGGGGPVMYIGWSPDSTRLLILTGGYIPGASTASTASRGQGVHLWCIDLNASGGLPRHRAETETEGREEGREEVGPGDRGDRGGDLPPRTVGPPDLVMYQGVELRDRGRPCFVSWSPCGQHWLSHVGDRISIQSVGTLRGTGTREDRTVEGGTFGTPCWAPAHSPPAWSGGGVTTPVTTTTSEYVTRFKTLIFGTDRETGDRPGIASISIGQTDSSPLKAGMSSPMPTRSGVGRTPPPPVSPLLWSRQPAFPTYLGPPSPISPNSLPYPSQPPPPGLCNLGG